MSSSPNIREDSVEQKFILSFIKIYQNRSYYIRALLLGSNSAIFIQRLKHDIFSHIINVLNLPNTNTVVTYTLDFYLSGVISAMSRWICNQEDIPKEELAKMIKDILSNGILPQIYGYNGNQN